MSNPVLWQLHPVPTIIITRNPIILKDFHHSRKSPRKRKIGADESVFFQATDKIIDIDSISEQNSPENVT